MATNQEKTRVRVQMAALDPYITESIPLPTEKTYAGRSYVYWGEDNLYPYYLLDLYNNVPTLRSIINGNVDFISGDDVLITDAAENPRLVRGVMNDKGDTPFAQVRDLARDYEIYGGFAMQVLRDYTGAVSEVYYIDVRYLRTDEEGTVFRYSEKWDKGGSRDVQVYPAFVRDLDWASLTDEERDRHASSILYVKNEHTQVYPAPIYRASVRDCEIERNITDFHINSLENGFVSSAIVNFNNGNPTDEEKAEVERFFNERFSGHQNAGRILFSWNRTKDNATTIDEFKIEDFGERYKALSTHARQQIFCAFRAIPALFGIMTESTGFNEQEFEQAFRLYNRTQIRPVQRIITDAYARIFGRDVITIRPFSIDEDVADTNI